MIRKIISMLAICAIALLPLTACRSTLPNQDSSGPVANARQALEDLPAPTFESLEVYVHDLSASGTALLLNKYPDARVPLRIVSDTAVSILETENITVIDLIALSESLDQIKDGKVKVYLDIAWSLLEMYGVIDRNDVDDYLTEREQRIVIALFNGIRLGTGPAEEREDVLNGYGPRY